MSFEPGRLPRRDAAGEVRGAARRAADSWRGAGLGAAFVGIGVALLFMLAFVAFDYTFDQDPHRIIKLGMGLLAVLAIMAKPKFGLLLLPVATPFLPWVPPAPVPGLNALNVLLFATFGTFALSRILGRQPVFRKGHLGTLIGLLILVCAVSIVRGAAFPTGYRYDGGLAALILFRSSTTFATYFIVHSMVHGSKERARVAWAVALGLLAEAIVTVMYGRNGSSGRAIGSLGQANELGAFLAMFTIFAFAMMAATRNWFGRVVLLGSFIAGATGIVYSVSRGALLSLAIGLLFVAWRSSRWLFAVMVLVLVSAPMWAPDYLVDRIKGTQKQVEGSDEVQLDKAAEARVQTWQTLLQIVQDHPLDGVGFAGLSYVLPDVGKELGLEDAVDSAHNTYLRMVAEMGIAGIVLFLWLMGRCLWLAEQGLRSARTKLDRGIAIGLSGATISMLVTCAFGDRFFNVVIASSYWVLCALVEDTIAERRGEHRVSGRALRWLLSFGIRPGGAHSGPPRLTIVRHHRVYADGERALYPLGVTESVLAGQLEACARAGLPPTTVREGLDRLARGDAGHAVAFSFDDGYADNVARALPLLERFAARATFYLTAGLMEERRAPWWDELVFVLEHASARDARLELAGTALALQLGDFAGRTAALRALLPLLRVPPGEQRTRLDALRAACGVEAAAPCELAEWPFARRLAQAGMEIGAHTLTHPFLSLCAEDVQRREIADSAALAARRTDAEVVGLAYPNGDHDDVTVRAAEASGLRYAVVTSTGVVRQGAARFRLPRRPLPQGACTGPFGGFSASMTLAELAGAFDAMRGRRAEAAS